MNQVEGRVSRKSNGGVSKRESVSSSKKAPTKKSSPKVTNNRLASGGRGQTLGVREIARRAGLDASGVSRILAGKRTSARLDTIKRIADVMGVSLDQVYKIMRNPRLRGV